MPEWVWYFNYVISAVFGFFVAWAVLSSTTPEFRESIGVELLGNSVWVLSAIGMFYSLRLHWAKPKNDSKNN